MGMVRGVVFLLAIACGPVAAALGQPYGTPDRGSPATR